MIEKTSDFRRLLAAYLGDEELSAKDLNDLTLQLKDPENIRILKAHMENHLEGDFGFREMLLNQTENHAEKQPALAPEQALAVLLQKLALENATEQDLSRNSRLKSLRVTFRRRGWRAAAILIVGLGISLLGYNLVRKSATETNLTVQNASTHSPQPIIPGSNGAILTLGDGRRILLDSLDKGSMNLGATTLKFGAGNIQYSAVTARNHPITYNLISTPRGKQFKIQLADGTQVWLNASSALRFPSAFDKDHRTVELDGEAYFEVVHNAASPFQVKVHQQLIEDIGTYFNINAYDNEKAVATTLVQGSVKVSQGVEKVWLHPGQQAMIVRGHFAVKKVDINEVIAWKSGFFLFSNTPLREIMQQISRWYDVDVEFRGGTDKTGSDDQLFTGRIDRALSLKDLLEGLQFTRIHFKIDENERKIIVKP